LPELANRKVLRTIDSEIDTTVVSLEQPDADEALPHPRKDGVMPLPVAQAVCVE
jgi:hypothetical protein